MIRRTRHIRRRVLLVLLRFPNLFVPNLAPDPLLALLSSAVCGSLSAVRAMHPIRSNTSHRYITQRLCQRCISKTNLISKCWKIAAQQMRRIADTQRGCFSRHQPAKPQSITYPREKSTSAKIASAGSHGFLRLRSVSWHLRRAAVLGFTKGYHD